MKKFLPQTPSPKLLKKSNQLSLVYHSVTAQTHQKLFSKVFEGGVGETFFKKSPPRHSHVYLFTDRALRNECGEAHEPCGCSVLRGTHHISA